MAGRLPNACKRKGPEIPLSGLFCQSCHFVTCAVRYVNYRFSVLAAALHVLFKSIHAEQTPGSSLHSLEARSGRRIRLDPLLCVLAVAL